MSEMTSRVRTQGKAGAGRPAALAAPDGDSRRWLMLPVILIAMFMAGFEVTLFP